MAEGVKKKAGDRSKKAAARSTPKTRFLRATGSPGSRGTAAAAKGAPEEAEEAAPAPEAASAALVVAAVEAAGVATAAAGVEVRVAAEKSADAAHCCWAASVSSAASDWPAAMRAWPAPEGQP